MENDEVKYYQPRFARWIKTEKWDSIADKLPDSCISTIRLIMNAEKDGDCSFLVWKNADYTLEKIRDIAKKINIFGRTRGKESHEKSK